MAEVVQVANERARRPADEEDAYIVVLDHRQLLGMLTALLLMLGLMFGVGYLAGRFWPTVEGMFGEQTPVVQPAPQQTAPAEAGPVTA